MSKKQEQEALTSLQKLDELTEDILKNNTDGGDANFRQIVFSGLTQTTNHVLLEKMQELLFSDIEKDLKKTIILGIFIHKEIFNPVIEYGEKVVTIPYLDESYDDKESFLFVLDALIELAYKNKLNSYETGVELFKRLYMISCSAKSSSVLADKLLQRILNSKVGTVKLLQKEFEDIIRDKNSEMNSRVIAIDILSRGQYSKTLDIIEDLIGEISTEDNINDFLSLIDVSTLALSYYTDKKFAKKVKYIVNNVQNLSLDENSDIVKRINRRIKKFQNDILSVN